MDKDSISKFIGEESLSIVDAMMLIDENSKGILFIHDESLRLTGSLTDGDIRRFILGGGNVKSLVSLAMNKAPFRLLEDNKNDANRVMKEKVINAIPIVTDENVIIDIAFLSDSENCKRRGSELTDVSAIIMAGGRGTRLYPYTKILPKPLIPIGDTPIIERIIDNFCDFGINQFYLSINYKKTMIKSYFEECSHRYSIKYVEEDVPLGTGGGIKLVADTFDKPIFVTNCDTLILADFNDVYHYHLNSENDITMVSALINFQIPYGVLHTGTEGRLCSIEEKPRLSYFVNTGMYVINPEMIELIPSNIIFHMTDLLDLVMSKGGKVGTYPISEESFLDMGELDAMKKMEEKLQKVSK